MAGVAFTVSYLRQWLECGFHIGLAQVCDLRKAAHQLLSLLQVSAESVLPPPACPMKNPNGKWKM